MTAKEEDVPNHGEDERDWHRTMKELVLSIGQLVVTTQDGQRRTEEVLQKVLEIGLPRINLPNRESAPTHDSSFTPGNQQPRPKPISELRARPRFTDFPTFNGEENRLISWFNEIVSWPRKLGLEGLDDLLAKPELPLANFLEGSALIWFEHQLTIEPFHSFIDFQKRLLTNILGNDWRRTLERTIEKRREKNESLDEYATYLRRITFVAYFDYPRDEREEKLAYAFAYGLRESSERLQCLARLKETPRTPLEYLLSLIRQHRSAEPDPEKLTVAALPLAPNQLQPRRDADWRPPPRSANCYRCNQPGHLARDCQYVLVPKKTLLDNGLVLTISSDQEKRLPPGTKCIRALNLEVDEELPQFETDPPADITPEFYVRALATIQTRDKPQWIKRETRVEIKLPWLNVPLLALFDCGADVTVLNAAYAEGAKMLNLPLPIVRDASDNLLPFIGVSKENLIMGNHTFPTLVVWAELSIDAILGMDVIGPWMLFPKWSSRILMSEMDPSIEIPFINVNGFSLRQYNIRVDYAEEDAEEPGMFAPIDPPSSTPVDLTSLVCPDLATEEKATLLEVLEDFRTLFEGDLTQCNRFLHSITLTESKPVHSPPRRVNPANLVIITEQVEAMLEKNIISPSCSPYSSPVHLVRRKNPDGTAREPRFCIDYRRLNEITVRDQYYLPAADDLLMCLGGYSYFATFDLRSGFWQVGMEEASKPLTAFTFPGGLYEFNVMPFGLCNAPATFQRLMDVVLGPLKNDIALVFVDDILIKGKTIQELADNCKKVFTKIMDANLRFNPSKAHVGFRRLVYLGHVISNEGIAPNPEKVQGIKDFPRPTNCTDVRKFMGMISYYRKFIPHLTNHSRPLEILGASKVWYWTTNEENAFQACKSILSQNALLNHPDYSLPFMIQTDASSIGLGAILLQLKDNVEKPLCYASRALSPAESKYHARELECLAVKWALKRFRPIIEGYPVTVVTDHESLVWLMRQDVPQGRLARWVLELQGTDFSVVHRSGEANQNADALSRSVPVQQLCSLSIPETNQDITWKDKFRIAQENDEECKRIHMSIEEGQDGYTIVDGVLCKRVKIRWQEWLAAVTPLSLRNEVLSRYHSDPPAGHSGIQLTFELIRRRFFWRGMRADIKTWIKRCKTCAATKPAFGKQPGTMGMVLQDHFNQLICIDHTGPFGGKQKKWILVMLDAASRWVEVDIVTSLSAKTTATHIEDVWFHRYGAPDAILTDNGTAFEGPPFRKLLEDWQVLHHKTSPYHPQANPVERLHADLKRILRAAAEEGGTWEKQLQQAAFCLRSKICGALKISPSELVLGIPMRMPLDITRSPQDSETDIAAAKENDQAAKKARKERYDQSKREVVHHQGDSVYVKRHVPVDSWTPPFTGPYEIIEEVSPLSYKLRHLNTGQIIRRHVGDLRDWNSM